MLLYSLDLFGIAVFAANGGFATVAGTCLAAIAVELRLPVFSLPQ